MFNIDHYKRLRLMGIRFETDPAAPPADPAAPATDPAAPAADPAKPEAPKPAPPANQPAETPEQRIARLEADNARLEREKADVRVQKEGELKKEAKRVQLLDVAKVAGIEITDPDKETVESLTEKLTGKVLKSDEDSTELQGAKLELAVYKTCVLPDVKVDPDKLTNSRRFVEALGKLDTSASDFNDKLKAAILAEATNDPSIKVSGGTTTSGADQYGGAGGGQEVTPEAFTKMGIAERTKLMRDNPQLYERLSA